MPIYEFECPGCGAKTEEISTSLQITNPVHCGGLMRKVPSAASFGFRTKGGNMVGFSGAHGVAKGSKKPAVIGHGHGVGRGKNRPTPSGV